MTDGVSDEQLLTATVAFAAGHDAIEFILQDEGWPVFLAWLGKNEGGPVFLAWLGKKYESQPTQARLIFRRSLGELRRLAMDGTAASEKRGTLKGPLAGG